MKHPVLAGITVSCLGLTCAVTLILPALKAVGIIESVWMLVLSPIIIIISLSVLFVLSIFAFTGGITMLAFFGGFLKGLNGSKQHRVSKFPEKESPKHDRSNLN